MLINCEICNKTFNITPNRLKNNKHHTCSKKCLGKLFTILHSKKIKTNCKNCNKEIFYKKSHFKEIKNPCCSKMCMSAIRSSEYKGKNNPKSLKLTDFEKYFWEKAQECNRRGNAKGLYSNITYLELIEIYNKQNQTCYYTNLPMQFRKKEKSEYAPYNALSVDRIDNNIGYIKDNVVFCLNCINMLKSNHNIEDIRNVIKNFYLKEFKNES